jgi:signal transduction histidine kinase
MSYFSYVTAIVAGISFGLGILYLFFGLRRKNDRPLNLSFSLFALGYAGAIVMGLFFHSATTMEQYLAGSRLDGLFVSVAFSALLWYVALYTAVKPRIFLWSLTALFLISGAANFFNPTLYNDASAGLSYLSLPWGETLAYAEPNDTAPNLIFSLGQFLTLVYIVVAIALQFWWGKRQDAAVLALGLLWFVITIAYELLGETRVVTYIPVGETGFLGMLFAISIWLSNTFIEAEEAVSRARERLEELVEERTGELGQRNEQLLVEINEREQADANRQAAELALERRVKELAILHQMAQTVAHTRDLPTTLRTAAETITLLLAARFSYIVIPHDTIRGELTTVGFDRQHGPIEPSTTAFKLEELRLARQVVTTGQSLLVPDLVGEDLHPAALKFATSHNLHGAIFVPLKISGDTVGALSVLTDETDISYTDNDVYLAETIAGDIAAAIENDRLLQTEKQAATIEERSRIARELHDSVTQTLYSISIVAEALPRIIDRSPAEAQRNASYLRRTTLGALAEMRTLLFELRPKSLAKAKLPILLQQLADVLTGRSRIPVEADVPLQGFPEQPAAVKIALYRIAQEAFNNIAKHSRASQSWLSLRKKSHGLILIIRDNGRGFDLASAPQDRLGIRGMRERAAEIGADLIIESTPTQGTVVTAIWANGDAPQSMDTKNDSGYAPND